MRVPLSWLKDFTPLPATPSDADSVLALQHTFDGLGLVVEDVERVGEGLESVVCAAVLEIRPIDGADRIREVIVDAATGDGLGVVCGAWNFAVGDVVPLAPSGSTLPGGFEIRTRRMRGVTSNGMLCSGRELGLSSDGAGLLVLGRVGEGAPAAGTPLQEALGIEPDVVFDLAIEPNRPDCLAVVGIARDVAAKLRLPFRLPEPTVLESGPPAAGLASVAVVDSAACPQLLGRVIEHVAPVASPPTVRRRLLLSGMRPINAVVDASNYVMLELGQPTHPYDLDRLGGGGILVRRARRGETLVTLDGTSHELGSEGDDELLICDAEDRPVGLAGIMGGVSSEIAPTTTRVLLEVAEFEPLVVGRTSARLGLRTEAFVRFWRGIDPAGLGRAADRFAELVLAAHAAASAPPPSVAPGRLQATDRVVEPRRIAVRPERVNALLGTELSENEIAGLLAPIGFAARSDAGGLDVEVPTFRPDATREVDVIEEVARHVGYDRIPRRERRSPYVGRRSPTQQVRASVRRLLVGLGALEAWTPSLVDPTLEAAAGVPAPQVRVRNPIAPDESVLRTHLLPGLLSSYRRNAAHRNDALRLFEVGNVFFRGERPDPVIEREHVGVLLALADDDAWSASAVFQLLLDGLRIADEAIHIDQPGLAGERASDALALGLHPVRLGVASVEASGLQVPFAAFGEVDPEVLAAFELEARRIGWLVVDLGALVEAPRRDAQAEPVSRFPSSDVDLAFVLADEVSAGELAASLRRSGDGLLESLRLLDVYRGPGIPPGARSLMYRLRFRAFDRTLDADEVLAARAKSIAAASQLGAELRA